MKQFLAVYFLLVSAIIPQEYNFRTFGTDNGLNNPVVFCIEESSIGLLYVGTTSGLAIFDGTNFRNLTTEDGLPSNNILSLKYIGFDSLFVGTRNGAAQVTHTGIKIIPTRNKNDKFYVTDIAAISSKIYFSTSKGIYVLNQDTLERDSVFNGLNDKKVYCIYRENGSDYFVATEEGVYVYKNNVLDHRLLNLKVYEILSKGNTKYFITVNGLYALKNDKLKKYSVKDGLPDNFIYDGTIDSRGNLWLATDLGLSKFDGHSFKNYNRSNGLISDNTFTVAETKGGNIWVGTNLGLALFDGDNVFMYTRSTGLKSLVWKIYEENRGDYLLGTDGHGLLRLKNNKFSKFDLSPLNPTTVWDILKDSDNNLWIATENGVIKKSDSVVSYFHIEKEINNDQVFNIFEDSDRNLWFTTAGSGVVKYNGKNFTVYNRERGLNHNTVYKIAEDNNKNIWIASEKGINKISNGKIVRFPGDSALINTNILDILFSANGDLILGSFQRGLLILSINEKENTFTLDNITEKDGLNNDAIMFLIRDIDFNLWIGTNSGLNRFDLLKYYSTGEKLAVPYNKWDGFLGIETNQNSAIIDSKGRLLYGTKDGLVGVNITKFKKYSEYSASYLKSIDINYKPILQQTDIDAEWRSGEYIVNPILPPDKNTITFNFTPLDFDNPTLVSFRYKLEGLEKEFSPFKRVRSVTYPSLPPGKYKFVLESRNRYGVVPKQSIEYEFTVEAPFYKTKLFFLFAVIFFAALFAWIYKIKVIDFRKTHQKLEQLYKETLEYEKILKKSEEDYKRLYDNAHDAIIVSDPETYEIIDVNQRTCELYGYEKHELIGKKLDIVTIDFERAKKNINNFMKIGAIRNLETVHRKKNGETFNALVNATLLTYKGKKAVVAGHRDITHEKETERNLIIAKEKAEKSAKLKSDFLAQVSHEIRTPLNVILNSVTLIEMETENPSEEVKYAFGAVRRSSDRIIKTISLILNMSEIQNRTYEPNFQKLKLSADILSGLYHENLQKAKLKNIELKFTPPEIDYSVYVDEYSVTQIFANLIDNAIKYTEKGYVKIDIVKENGSLRVDVIDTGIGINKEFIPEIFDPFAQEEQGYTRKFDGNGLGMALVKNYCELNGLQIEITSEKGKGSTFSIIFGKFS